MPRVARRTIVLVLVGVLLVVAAGAGWFYKSQRAKADDRDIRRVADEFVTALYHGDCGRVAELTRHYPPSDTTERCEDSPFKERWQPEGSWTGASVHKVRKVGDDRVVTVGVQMTTNEHHLGFDRVEITVVGTRGDRQVQYGSFTSGPGVNVGDLDFTWHGEAKEPTRKSSGSPTGSPTTTPKASLPKSVDIQGDVCDVLDQPAAEDLLGVSLEAASYEPGGPEGLEEWFCLMKEVGGSDSAPSVVLEVDPSSSPADVEAKIRDKEQVVSTTCTTTTEDDDLYSNHCTGGYSGDVDVYNYWFFAGETQVLCGVGPVSDEEAGRDYCEDQFEGLA